MNRVILSLGLVLTLSACAGGLPPSSSNGLKAYDMVFGLRAVPEGADNSRVWSPVHQIYGGKPDWSVVWFQEKTKDGSTYELTARPLGETEETRGGEEPAPGPYDRLTKVAEAVFGEAKSWLDRLFF